MKLLGWILALFALAVGITLAARYNAGYALFVWPPYRVELTLNLFIVLAVAAFAGLYLLIRLASGALGLPARMRAARERRRAARGRSALNDALRAFLERRYGRARKAADLAAGMGESPALAAMIAARASHELRDYPARDAALSRVEAAAPQEVALRAIAQGEMLLAEQRPQEALAALAALGERRTAALRLELRAHRELKHWDEVLRLTAELEKRGVFDADQAAQLRRAALVENLERKALDAHALAEYWDRLRRRTGATRRSRSPRPSASPRWAAARRRTRRSRRASTANGTRSSRRRTASASAGRDRAARAGRALAHGAPARRESAAHAGTAVRAPAALGQGAELSRGEHRSRGDLHGTASRSPSCTTGSAPPTPRAGITAPASGSRWRSCARRPPAGGAAVSPAAPDTRSAGERSAARRGARGGRSIPSPAGGGRKRGAGKQTAGAREHGRP